MKQSSLTRPIIRSLLSRKSLLFSHLAAFVLCGIFLAMTYRNFLFLQSQNIDQLSVFSEIINPLVGLVLILQLLLSLLVVSNLVPYWSAKGQRGIFFYSAMSPGAIAVKLVKIVFVISFLLWSYFVLIGLSVAAFTSLDLIRFASSALALLLAQLFFNSCLLMISLSQKSVLLNLIKGLVFLGIWISIEALLLVKGDPQWPRLVLGFVLHLRDGYLELTELIVYMLCLAGAILFLLLRAYRFKAQPYSFIKGKSSSLILAVTFSFILASFYYSASKNLVLDLTANQLNSISPSDQKQLKSIKEPIAIKAVINSEIYRDEIRRAFSLLKPFLTNASLSFSNLQAEQLSANQSRLNNLPSQIDEYVAITIGEQQQNLAFPFDRKAKEALSKGILQLADRKNQWITFIEGHGEVSPFDSSNRGMKIFYQSLKKIGWPLAVQNLSNGSVSKNTQLMIVAGSKTNWLKSEINQVVDYLSLGGNLLWLREADDFVPAELEKYLGVTKVQGTLVDWQGYQNGTPHPAVLVVNQFLKHPINQGIDSLLAFPWSVGLKRSIGTNLNFDSLEPVLMTHKGVWNEFDIGDEVLSLNAELGEQQKAFVIGFALMNASKNQRVLLLGDSTFVSDTAINNYANHQFSLNSVSWLLAKKADVKLIKNKDNFIAINSESKFVFTWVFTLILPLMFLLAIGLRRRAKAKALRHIQQ